MKTSPRKTSNGHHLHDIEVFFEESYPGTSCICAPIYSLQQELFPLENQYVRKCVNKRRQEFIAGRSAARLAMRRLCLAPDAILRGNHREPLWPENLVGSISHTDNVCLCVVSEKKHYSAIGIDIEELKRMDASFFPSIFSEKEIQQLNLLNRKNALLFASAAFSAKEAFFKLQYPTTQKWLDFKDGMISIYGDQIELELSPMAIAKGLRHKYAGILKRNDRIIVTGFASPSSG